MKTKEILKTGLSILAILFILITAITDNLAWLIGAGGFIIVNIVLVLKNFKK